MNRMSYMSLLQPQTSSRTIRDFYQGVRNRTNRNEANFKICQHNPAMYVPHTHTHTHMTETSVLHSSD